MRHIKVLDGLNQTVENFGYAIGEAQDFCDRNEPLFCDLIDRVAAGKVAAADAKRVVRLAFMNATNDIGEWRKLRADVAREHGHPYLHESLSFRIVAPLPDVTA